MDDLTTLSQDSPSQVEGTNIVSDKGSQRSVPTSVPVTHSKVEARSIEGIFNSISTNLIRKLLSHYHANGSKASIVDHIVPHPTLPAALIESIKDEDAHIPRPYPCSQCSNSVGESDQSLTPAGRGPSYRRHHSSLVLIRRQPPPPIASSRPALARRSSSISGVPPPLASKFPAWSVLTDL